MTRTFWKRQHKWFGLALCFFLLMSAVSGIILNHRAHYSKVNVSRAVLPSSYKYRDWNSGLLRGTLRLDSASALIYGYSGIWLHRDKIASGTGSAVTDFNTGLPGYADYRVIRNIVFLPDSTLVAASQYGLFRRSAADKAWRQVSIVQAGRQERFSDVACLGDSLVVLTRDHVYLSLPPYREFKQISLEAPDNYDGRVSLFRVFWLFHNGEILGIAGRFILDLIGASLILLCMTGFFFWLCPKLLKSGCFQTQKKRLQGLVKFNYKWHKKIGVWTFFILLFVVVTGWCLRPPLLIPLALNKVPGIPNTPISPDTPWVDKLRAIRYDDAKGDWLLSTGEGFFSIAKDLTGQPKAVTGAPHVSVMGINVFQKDRNGDWLIGSFSGMWRWDRATGKVSDYYTGKPMPEKAGAPFGKTPVSGFSADFMEPVVAEYYDGDPAHFPTQPEELSVLPMSLWQLALEVHTGRIYNLFGLAPLIWIFLIGLATLWVFISGWKLRR